jgi:imidazolonepropionase-like amidohydrolase
MNIFRRALFAILLATAVVMFPATKAETTGAQSAKVKALVGGTLIDGYGSKPIRNSVIIIEGERITRVGQVGALAIPAGAEVISSDGI